MDNKKKILVVDDSALMRRIVCDIINLDEQFCVQDMAANGLEAISLMQKIHMMRLFLILSCRSWTGSVC